MLENPAIEDSRLSRLRWGRLAAGEVPGRICGHKGCDRVTEIGGDQDHQPKARDVGALAGGIEGEQAQRHQRIAEEVGDFQEEAKAGAGCAGGSGRLGHQPAVEGQEALFDAVVRALERLAGLPVRDKEESDCQPVTQSGNVERGKDRCCRAGQHHRSERNQRKQRDVPAPPRGQWTREKRLDPGGNCQDERKPDLDPLGSPHPAARSPSRNRITSMIRRSQRRELGRPGSCRAQPLIGPRPRSFLRYSSRARWCWNRRRRRAGTHLWLRRYRPDGPTPCRRGGQTQ